MELRTEGADRLLEALTPALTAELERIVNETRQTLEAEFEKRLQSTIRETESAMRAAAESELQHAVAKTTEETREAVRKQVIEELEPVFTTRLHEAAKSLVSVQAEFKQLQEAWNTDRELLHKQIAQWRIFAEAQPQLMDAGSQPEILIRWLKLAEPFAPSIAVYTAKADGLALWKSRGPTVFPEIISQETTDPETYFKTIVVRGKTVAAVSAAQPCQAEALDFLAGTIERAIELFGLRLRSK